MHFTVGVGKKGADDQRALAFRLGVDGLPTHSS